MSPEAQIRQPTFSETERARVDELLAGIGATRDGERDMFFIEGSSPDDAGLLVTSENAVEVERSIRQQFASVYPELLNPVERD